ncbi:hypothetical protein TIFTF001_034911 [Ficus carica]|uniref:Uncharacterized protein n=1 Tax=Ficus carica TaxID=3494 RepID=A0AA88E1D0_FICCA|nr:hypothetical protein TIFTF001_034911 [Ficus carica]
MQTGLEVKKLVGGVEWKDFEVVCFAIVQRWREIIAMRNTSDHLKNFILRIEALNLNGNTADDKGRRIESRILLGCSTDPICQMAAEDSNRELWSMAMVEK